LPADGVTGHGADLVRRLTTLLLLLPLLAPARAVADPLQVWCVGDSIVLRYARRLQALEPGWAVTDLGVGGERSDEGRARLEEVLRDRSAPDVAIIIYGANDLVAGRVQGMSGHGPESAATNIRAMAARLRAAGAIPIVALPVGSPPPRPDDPESGRRTLVTLRRGFRELRALLQRERPHVDFRLTRHEQFVDAVHPSPTGATLIAKRASQAVRRVLARTTRGEHP
jgi:lysophospholipase L1-like esterase